MSLDHYGSPTTVDSHLNLLSTVNGEILCTLLIFIGTVPAITGQNYILT